MGVYCADTGIAHLSVNIELGFIPWTCPYAGLAAVTGSAAAAVAPLWWDVPRSASVSPRFLSVVDRVQGLCSCGAVLCTKDFAVWYHKLTT